MPKQIFALLLIAWAVPADAQVIRYYHTDITGSVVAVTDENANVIERRVYEPYGLPQTPIPDGPGYTGHDMDGETGLVYMQQRYYDPLIGRFLSVDPMAVTTTTAWNFNRYNYAANNPYRNIDPDGRAVCVVVPPAPICAAAIAKGAAAVVGGAGAAYGILKTAVGVHRALPQKNESADSTDTRIAEAKEKLRPGHGAAGEKGQMEGDADAADAIKDSLGATNERTVRRGEGGTATLSDLSDGSTVVDYPSGGGDEYPPGTRTIEIQRPSGKSDEKWRFPERDGSK